MQAIILAGGKGVRLKPYTAFLPKPLMPIDDVPILEVVLRQLKNAGFSDVVLSLNHLSSLFMALFKDGTDLGLNIKYSIEDKPLGTAGPISIVDELEDSFLVMNGDLLTSIDYAELMRFHKENKNDATISLYKKEIKIDLGVVTSSKNSFVDYIEKPTYSFDVSMGIYVFNKSVLKYIKKNQRLDLPDLIHKLQKAGKKIGCYSGSYYWLDIGRFDDFEKAIELFRERRGELLPGA